MTSVAMFFPSANRTPHDILLEFRLLMHYSHLETISQNERFRFANSLCKTNSTGTSSTQPVGGKELPNKRHNSILNCAACRCCRRFKVHRDGRRQQSSVFDTQPPVWSGHTTERVTELTILLMHVHRNIWPHPWEGNRAYSTVDTCS